MADAPRANLRSRRGTVGVACVLALAGLLFTSNATLASSSQERDPEDLSQLVQAESDRVEARAADVESLRTQIDTLTDAQTADSAQRQLLAPLTELAAGSVAVTGPGLTVQLTDALSGTVRADEFSPDDLVVHQQDLQSVINALWAGGAEAMTLQDRRVVSTSAFRCVGNVLLLHGRTYSPPYVVRAVGDPQDMREALLRSPGVRIYLEYVKAVGLGWTVSQEDELKLPAFEGGLEMKHARLPAGVTVGPEQGAL